MAWVIVLHNNDVMESGAWEPGYLHGEIIAVVEDDKPTDEEMHDIYETVLNEGDRDDLDAEDITARLDFLVHHKDEGQKMSFQFLQAHEVFSVNVGVLRKLRQLKKTDDDRRIFEQLRSKYETFDFSTWVPEKDDYSDEELMDTPLMYRLWSSSSFQAAGKTQFLASSAILPIARDSIRKMREMMLNTLRDAARNSGIDEALIDAVLDAAKKSQGMTDEAFSSALFDAAKKSQKKSQET